MSICKFRFLQYTLVLNLFQNLKTTWQKFLQIQPPQFPFMVLNNFFAWKFSYEFPHIFNFRINFLSMILDHEGQSYNRTSRFSSSLLKSKNRLIETKRQVSKAAFFIPLGINSYFFY